jgi:uncharacterized membrane protein (UPF0136 family)
MSRSEPSATTALRAPRLRLRTGMAIIAAIAALTLMAARLWLAAAQPLWFDEAWALAVAAAPDWRSVVHEAWVDVNAPLYYLLLHAWTAVAGPSDLALRLPGLLAVAVAGAIPLLRRVPGLSFESRLAWGVMLFAWWGLDIFLAGRGYGLLLALSVAQCVLFAELIRKPATRTALVWAVLGALAVLTHYYALIVTAVQGLAYLAVCRGRALRTWPAALAFVPAAGWIAWHAPRVMAFASADVAWHGVVGPLGAVAMASFTLNPSAPASGLLVAIAAAAAFLLSRRPAAPETPPLWIAAAASLAALAISLATGMLHPSLAPRYLTPTAPGLLLGLVLLAQGSARPRLAVSAVATVYLTTALWPGALADAPKRGSPYGFETASDILMRHGASDVVFAWDHEVTALMPPATLERLGGVFFRRAGTPVRVRPLVARPIDDLNALALAAATGPRPGIIWIYNRDGRTAARAHPPEIAARDPRWTCQRIGDETVGSLACWRP